MPIIEHSSTAVEGKVSSLSQYSPSLFPLGSAILCRNTAPLVSFAYSLLNRDIPCRIIGRDIGTALISLVRRMRAQNLEELQEKLKTWLTREVSRAESEGRSPEALYDRYECLQMFIKSLDEDSRSIASLIAKIELMFTDANANGFGSRITLATIHKAKGLEFPTVFILDPHLLPSRYAKQPWQIRQEKNLKYVAITRAKENLFYISSGCWKEDKAVS